MLRRLSLQQFRNYPQLEFFPDSSVSLVIGANGSGKTSLLESIYTLSTGRSFRTAQLQKMIHHDFSELNIFAEISDGDSGCHRIGVSRNRQGIAALKVDGSTRHNLSDVAQLFPVQIFSPTTVDLLFGENRLRRSFLDWGLFHVEHEFLSLSRRYKLCLSNRNSLLKQRKALPQIKRELSPWNQQLISISDKINGMRRHYVSSLVPYLMEALKELNFSIDVQLSYSSGWTAQMTYAEALLEKTEVDIERGFTSVGPHRADLRVSVPSGVAKEMLSRGQSKVIAYALLLSQLRHFTEYTGKSCLILVDDLAAELDPSLKLKLLDLLIASGQQLIITSLDDQWLSGVKKTRLKVFHVEHNELVAL